MKQQILVIFPLANDVESKENEWVDIGSNAKCRIDDVVFWTKNQNAWAVNVIVFAAGTDLAHSAGPTLARLGARYFQSAHGQHEYSCVINQNERDVYGTDPEIVWGVTAVLARYPPEYNAVMFVFGTQARHMPRVRKIVTKRFPGLTAAFITTKQTKEIPLWRETISGIKLMLGDGWIGSRVQRLRRAFPDRFDRA